MDLRCPNCDHLIGRLHGPSDSTTDKEQEAVDPHLARWYREVYWPIELPAGQLYDMFVADTGRADVSKKAFGLALAKLGARPRRGAQGVRLWAHN
jgi:hypothetical protein